MDSDELTQQMKSLADIAVALARDQHQIELDFSEDSLKLVEQILARLSEDVPKSRVLRLLGRGPSRAQIESICQMMGAYIGEVIRRKWEARWHMDPAFGSPLPALSVHGGKMYPTNKVYKRLVHGEGDNIWAYYEMLKHIGEHGPLDGRAQPEN
jgi:hypothetical protein